MLKSFCGIVAVLVFGAMVAFAATVSRESSAAPVAAPTVQADPTPFVFESSAVLVLAKALDTKPAPTVARNAPKAKAYQCGAWEDSQIGGAYKRCEWR